MSFAREFTSYEVERLIATAERVVAARTPNIPYTLAAEINDLYKVLHSLGVYS